ncbi:MAG: L,D-transpeptidase/peptidoglycan binding protein [Lachnospiraceae bacterium]|nr:L,D-transpeptidase/peptidoglycan binding protein [Lachnospiraceae bacterium]
MANDKVTENRPAENAGAGRSRKRKRVSFLAGGVVLGLFVAAGGAYVLMGQEYRRVFFPNTTINGLDASGLTVEKVQTMIASGMEGYKLTLEERGGTSEQIGGEEIDLHPEYDGSLELILAGQNPLRWGAYLTKGDSYTIETMMSYDKDKLLAVVSGLDCLQEANLEAPKDAYLSDYITGSGYEIIPEVQGNTPDSGLLLDSVSGAILNLKPTLSLEEEGVYKKPQITAEDEGLKALADAWNLRVQTTVTYQFGDQREVLDGERIHTWLTSTDDGMPLLDETKITEYVAELAKNHNTAYKPKTLKTSYGPTVTITGGPYGWRINQSAEAAALSQILQSGQSQEREPVYSQTAASHGAQDYGTTYVEINLTAQHLYYYKDGSLIAQADFVSGNEAKGWSTPAGAYPLTYKQRNATLKGQGYATPVSYWMPFNGGIGLHDAGWRSSFGGNIYKTGGSHGCVNLPPATAKQIYENISAGTPVLCYHLGGTNKGSSTVTPAETTAAATTAAPTETTAPAETTAAAAAPQETAPVGPGTTETTAAQANPAGPGAAPETTAAATPSPNPTQAPQQTPQTPQQTPQTPQQTPQTSQGSQASPQPGTSATKPQVQDTPGTAQNGTSPAGPDSKTNGQAASGAVSGPGA